MNHYIIRDMKTEIENIIYNYADELKIGGQSEIQIPHILIEGVSKCPHPLFYAQSPDFLKPELCYFLKFLYL